MNDSPSTISPAWPTRWPANSFKGFRRWLFVGALALLFVGLFVSAITNPPPQINPGQVTALLLGQSVIEGIFVIVVLALLPWLTQFSLRELGFRMPNFATLAYGLLGALGMFVLANGSAYLIDLLTHSQHQQDVVKIFEGLHDTGTIAFFAAFAVLFVPFAEETIFRLLFFNFGLRYGGFWMGALISGVLFGVAHGDLYEAFPLCLGGIVLSAVYYRSRNAWASMISHALFNSISIVGLLFLPKLTH